MSGWDVVTGALADGRAGFERLPRPRTETALAEARALSLPSGEVTKTLVVRTRDGFARAVIPASERLVLRQVRDIVGGGKHTHLATKRSWGASTALDLGAIPPVGKSIRVSTNDLGGIGPARARRRNLPGRGSRG